MGKVFGYARISTPKQNIERQIRNIKDYDAAASIYAEAYTGTKSDRPEWNKLRKRVKSGDTIIFDSVSRMSRDAEEGYKAYMELYDQGVNLVFLKEMTINTDNYKSTAQIAMTGTDADVILEGVNKYLMILAEKQIKIAFDQSEKEVEDLHKRTAEGIETARKNGKQIGAVKGKKLTTKKSIEMKDKIRKMAKSFGGNMSDKEVIETLKLARATYYKYKREMLEEE